MTSRTRAIASKGHRDDNEADIITALEKAGCLVVHVEGEGVPDLVVCPPMGIAWRLVLLEVKNGSRGKHKRKDQAKQDAFREKWTAAGAPVFKVTSVDEALRAVGAL